ncbi:MAG: D-alanine--D-alanine ligase [Limnochordales bacterium]|nr:D-alanine--D-alanine ligase [Limnochordales bacterium]
MTTTSSNHGKTRVGLIYGGRSSEHEVSLQSAAAVFRAFDPARYEVIPIAVDHAGRFWTGRAFREALKARAASLPLPGESGSAGGPSSGPGECLPVHARLDPTRPGFFVGEGQEAELLQLDVVFPLIHGTYGEDGTLQGLLEMMGLPYVGAGVLGSAVGMDKVMMKAAFRAAGLPILSYQAISRYEWEKQPELVQMVVAREIGFPCFVKPANLGSSVGVSKVLSEKELPAALARAFLYSRKVLAERAALNCREIECSVLGADEVQASIPGEIRPSRDFYDYQAKYQDETSELIIPAQLPPAVVERVRELSIAAFRAVDAVGMARVDFFVARESGAIYVNEINTIPGFTRISMYPKLWEASGLPFPALVDRLVELAFVMQTERARTLYRYDPEAEEAVIRQLRE